MELNIAQRFLFLLCCSNFASMSQTARTYAIAGQSVRLSVCHTGGSVKNCWS